MHRPVAIETKGCRMELKRMHDEPNGIEQHLVMLVRGCEYGYTPADDLLQILRDYAFE